jgi:trehalose/maltose hydrolase-like predicted phosphorylase
MGPDEYHEVVDDNAFTNVMARWNLRKAAELAEPGSVEAAHWRELADLLVDGYNSATGRYEQFAGYWELKPLLITELATPPVAADVLLGAERVAQSQIIKQSDVLMLHHLVPDEVAPGSLGPNLAFYGPRTAHGSSLSSSVHAALLARAGEPNRALEVFRIAARLDLDDLGGTTAGGLHLANLGGVWQALAFGFLGLRARGDALEVDPRLPDAWQTVDLSFRFRGQPVGVRAERDRVVVRCAEPLAVRTPAGRIIRCEPPGHTLTGEGRT